MFNWIKKIRNSLLRWAVHKKHITTARLLIKLEADIDVADYSNRIETLKSILNKGVGADSKGKALLFAAANDHKEIVELLLKEGVDAEYIGEALKSAVYFGHQEIVEFLKNKMSSIDKKELLYCDIKTLKYLLENEIINEVDIKNYGAELLSNAYYFRFTKKDEIEWLLEHGVDVDAKDNEGKTALDLIAKDGCAVVIRSLLKHKVVDTKGSDEVSTLHLDGASAESVKQQQQRTA